MMSLVLVILFFTFSLRSTSWLSLFLFFHLSLTWFTTSKWSVILASWLFSPLWHCTRWLLIFATFLVLWFRCLTSLLKIFSSSKQFISISLILPVWPPDWFLVLAVWCLGFASLGFSLNSAKNTLVWFWQLEILSLLSFRFVSLPVISLDVSRSYLVFCPSSLGTRWLLWQFFPQLVHVSPILTLRLLISSVYGKAITSWQLQSQWQKPIQFWVISSFTHSSFCSCTISWMYLSPESRNASSRMCLRWLKSLKSVGKWIPHRTSLFQRAKYFLKDQSNEWVKQTVNLSSDLWVISLSPRIQCSQSTNRCLQGFPVNCMISMWFVVVLSVGYADLVHWWSRKFECLKMTWTNLFVISNCETWVYFTPELQLFALWIAKQNSHSPMNEIPTTIWSSRIFLLEWTSQEVDFLNHKPRYHEKTRKKHHNAARLLRDSLSCGWLTKLRITRPGPAPLAETKKNWDKEHKAAKTDENPRRTVRLFLWILSLFKSLVTSWAANKTGTSEHAKILVQVWV